MGRSGEKAWCIYTHLVYTQSEGEGWGGGGEKLERSGEKSWCLGVYRHIVVVVVVVVVLFFFHTKGGREG